MVFTNGLVLAINVLVILFAFTAMRRLKGVAGTGVSDRAIAIVISIAAAIGLANAWLPPLAKLRVSVPPAQPAMVLLMIGGLLAVLLGTRGRVWLGVADMRELVGLHRWRLAFGALLLATGLSGGLPTGFYPSVAAGDMVAGLWAIAIYRRGDAGFGEMLSWCLLGLADLLHVLPLAVLHLPPFYRAFPDINPPILLPLLGVPMLIALHGGILFRLIRDRTTT